MRERREKGGDLASLRSATSSQIAQVAAARAALGQIREGIWSPDTEAADDGGNGHPPAS
jgi:hypothetical protein